MTRTFHAVVPDGGDEIGGKWIPIYRCDRDIPFGRSNRRGCTPLPRRHQSEASDIPPQHSTVAAGARPFLRESVNAGRGRVFGTFIDPAKDGNATPHSERSK